MVDVGRGAAGDGGHCVLGGYVEANHFDGDVCALFVKQFDAGRPDVAITGGLPAGLDGDGDGFHGCLHAAVSGVLGNGLAGGEESGTAGGSGE